MFGCDVGVVGFVGIMDWCNIDFRVFIVGLDFSCLGCVCGWVRYV